MEKSNFEKIIEFHQSFELPYNKEINKAELQNFKTVSLRIKLIYEEMNELYSAKTMIQQLDAIGDLLYVVYGAGASFGFDLDKLFNDEYCRLLDSVNIKKRVTGTNFRKLLHLYSELNTTLDSPACFYPNYILTNKSIDFPNKLTQLSHYILLTDCNTVQIILVRMLFDLYGVGYFCRFDLDSLYAEIHRSNMSKLCNTEQEAIYTVNWYIKNQAERYPKPAYHKSSDDKYYIVFEQTTNKRLKSINYSEPKIVPDDLKI